MARIKAHLLTQETHPCGRLVPLKADYDSAERIMMFTVPSDTREDRVYGIEVDALTGECICPCEAFSDFRNATKMPYRLERAGTYVEQVAKAHKKYVLPLITRKPSGLCRHLKKVRLWVQRHELMWHFDNCEKWLLEKLEQKVSA